MRPFSISHNYTKNDGREKPRIPNLFSSRIDNEVACNVEKPFSVEEVNIVVMSMGKDKSLGPDGFSMLFYRDCWDIIQADLMEVFAEFFEIGLIIKGINATSLICLLKKNDVKEMANYRPISLVGNLYKIVAKVLPSRLKEVIESVVLNSQSAFVKCIQILVSTLIANECVDERKKSKKLGIVCMIDFKKAYDRVDWAFLTWTLEQKGFGER